MHRPFTIIQLCNVSLYVLITGEILLYTEFKRFD